MKVLKPVLVFLSAFSFVFFIFYLFGCFYSMSFDISKWSEDSRALICICSGLFGAFISPMSLMFYLEHK